MKDEVRGKAYNLLWEGYQGERKRSAELLLKIERLEATIRLREREIELLNKKLVEVQLWQKKH